MNRTELNPWSKKHVETYTFDFVRDTIYKIEDKRNGEILPLHYMKNDKVTVFVEYRGEPYEKG